MNEQPQKAEIDRQRLIDAQQKGPLATLGTFARLSGPGWLQSAITLGGGSLANGLYLGIFTGLGMLWLQPSAMILGIVMLAAIAYVTTSTGERPFAAINRHVNPVLGWSWLLASLLANMVWALPQYSLATGVLQKNLLPGVLGSDGPLGDTNSKIAIVVGILVFSTLITWAYDSGRWGIKLYELILKLMVAMIVICFLGVIIALRRELDWGQIFAGFVPDVTKIYQPSAEFADLLAAVPEKYRDFWSATIVGEQQKVIVGATATAVGINMTFLFPYSLLAKGWTREFRGLAIFDLATGMLIPFVLATSCVVIAAANQFHPRPGIITPAEGELLSAENQQDWQKQRLEFLEADGDAQAEELTAAEQKLAIHLIRRNAFDLAQSLAPFTGRQIANYVFGVGVLGMTLSTISILMLISGFCICEALGLPPKGWPHRLGCLAAVTGVLGPFLWTGGTSQFWLAVPTSVFGMMLLPIAYWTFFALMNQRSLLGDDLPRGGRRVVWNVLMLIAAGVATYLCILAINNSPLGPGKKYPYGYYFFAALGALALVTHFAKRKK